MLQKMLILLTKRKLSNRKNNIVKRLNIKINYTMEIKMFVLKSTYDNVVSDRDFYKRNYIELRCQQDNGEIQRLRDKISELEKTIKDLYADELYSANVAVDYKRMNAVSIERINDEGKNCTVIGYKNPADSISEWFLHCSIEKHNELARRFEQYIGKKHD